MRLPREVALLSLNTNMMALMARRSWAQTESALAVTTARLSSGLRINSARDDAAGLAISERLLAQIRGTDVAARNANDAVSRTQMGESATGSVVDALQRMNELAVQAANGTLTSADRALLEVSSTNSRPRWPISCRTPLTTAPRCWTTPTAWPSRWAPMRDRR